MKTFCWSGKHQDHAGLPRPSLVLLSMLTYAFMASAENPEKLDPQLAGFVKAKEQQARLLAESLHIEVSPDVWKGFELFRQGDWTQASNHFAKLMERNAQYRGSVVDEGVGTPVWQPLMEVDLVFAEFFDGEPKYARAFGEDIIASIPPGSIYFGGTDAGRGLVTGLMRSHVGADPFFVITQNALADANYLNYLRHMYGHRIYIPSESDCSKTFQDYVEDAQKRLQENKLRPGEEVRIVDHRVQVSGQVAVMSINGRLAEAVFKGNPDRGFYLEESFPLDWMYPHLVPHNLVLKIERDPLATLSDELVKRNHHYWEKYCGRLIGDWLQADTPVRDIAAFAERVHRLKDFSGFKASSTFTQSDRARKSFSKLRSAQGGVYQWRFQNAKSGTEREAMSRAADLAFRQAFALCPYSPEAVFRYVNLLLQLGRNEDALVVAETCHKFDPSSPPVSRLIDQLKSFSKRSVSLAELEQTIRDNPTNFQAALKLAASYLQLEQTNRAHEVFARVLHNPQIDANAVLAIAQSFAQMGNFAKLEETLNRLVQVVPESPEAWYDLAAVRIAAGKKAQTITALREAVRLSNNRLREQPDARDLVAEVKNDPRFHPVRELPEYKQIVSGN